MIKCKPLINKGIYTFRRTAKGASKSVKMRPLKGLTAKQLTVIAAVVAGATDDAAGKLAGVGRQSISRWRNDPQFVSELNAQQNKQAKELTAIYSKNTRSLVNAALNVIALSLKKEDAQSARWLLDAVRFSEWGQSVFQKVVNPTLAPEDVDEVIGEIASANVDGFLTAKSVSPVDKLRLREGLIRREVEALKAENGAD